uniref:Cadherin domain-containing protein n=1 Tax=Varanus komodoensis TaxID=61221 RepID=A0A8D2L5U1_VARKO
MFPFCTRFLLGKAEDPDIGVNSLQDYQLSSNQYFTLDVKKGQGRNNFADLVLQKPLDRESEQTLHLILTALDGGEPRKTGTAQIWINVTDANDNPPVFSQEVYTVNLRENAPVGSQVLQIVASDRDDGPNAKISYHFNNIPANAKKKFNLDAISGTITLIESLDFEETKEYTMTIAGKDGGGLVTHCKVEITILDENDNAPEIMLASLVNPVSEDTALGAVIAYIIVTDKDTGDNGKVTCHLHGDPPFRILPTSSNYYKLLSDGPLDRERTPEYNITVTASDAGSPPLSTHKSITLQINVTDANDNPPVFSQEIYRVSLSENAPLGSQVLQVVASDQDEGSYAQIRYHFGNIPAEAQKKFKLDPINGAVTLVGHLDYEDTKEYTLTAAARDGGGSVTHCKVHMLVVDENDNAPEVALISLFSPVPEDSPPGTLIALINVKDKDLGDDGKATEPTLFTVGAHTGEVRTARPFTERDVAKQKLVVLVKDNGRPPLSATATLNLVFAENFQEALPEMKSQPGSTETQAELQFYLVLALAVMSFLFLLTVILAVAMRLRHSGSPTFLQCLGPLPHPKAGAFFPPNFEEGTLPYSYQLCLSSESKRNEFTFVTPNVQVTDNILSRERSGVPFGDNVHQHSQAFVLDLSLVTSWEAQEVDSSQIFASLLHSSVG